MLKQLNCRSFILNCNKKWGWRTEVCGDLSACKRMCCGMPGWVSYSFPSCRQIDQSESYHSFQIWYHNNQLLSLYLQHNCRSAVIAISALFIYFHFSKFLECSLNAICNVLLFLNSMMLWDNLCHSIWNFIRSNHRSRNWNGDINRLFWTLQHFFSYNWTSTVHLNCRTKKIIWIYTIEPYYFNFIRLFSSASITLDILTFLTTATSGIIPLTGTSSADAFILLSSKTTCIILCSFHLTWFTTNSIFH